MTRPPNFTDENLALRKEIGRRLKALRERRGLSQNDMIKLLALDTKAFISQTEVGLRKVPPDRYADWAAILGVELRPFVQMLLKFYDPLTYVALFADADPYEALKSAQVTDPEERVAVLSHT